MQVEGEMLSRRNNFYASFFCVTKAQVRKTLETNGWRSRKAGWNEFELTNDWSELMLEGDETAPLLNGVVVFDKHSLEKLDRTFEETGGQFLYEFYSDERRLLFEKKSSG